MLEGRLVGLLCSLEMEILLRSWQELLCNLPGKSHGRRSLEAAVHGVAKSRTRLSNFTFTSHFHSLEKEMATHSSVLAWRIPGMGEPGGLPSMGSHRVGHDWSDLAAAASVQEILYSKPLLYHLWLNMISSQVPALSKLSLNVYSFAHAKIFAFFFFFFWCGPF